MLEAPSKLKTRRWALADIVHIYMYAFATLLVRVFVLSHSYALECAFSSAVGDSIRSSSHLMRWRGLVVACVGVGVGADALLVVALMLVVVSQ
jgi:hypothetical protein